MPSYTLTYFDKKGRGEPIRWLLSYLNKEFEDKRIQIEEWPKIRNGILFGQLPVLDVNGKRLYQTDAICRYLAREGNLAGDNSLESQEIDSIVGSYTDLFTAVVPLWSVSDPKEKEELKDKLKSTTIPSYFKIYDDIAKSGYLANGKLSWADIFFIATLSTLDYLLSSDVIADYPNLVALRTKIINLPGIKEWIEKHP
ncbi:unnamed protein product [Nesidiocoris tenuis]|uniref:Glutathione n=2 Tax=Nesidiocoris tenuis TaxID=355587 RepID=A0ABN7AA76_9HEMI|nr:Glutathione [Nesidiocoris tenuis]CAB0001365.1 unnamed protein product [Nesidiocoris tenuis]